MFSPLPKETARKIWGFNCFFVLLFFFLFFGFSFCALVIWEKCQIMFDNLLSGFGCG